MRGQLYRSEAALKVGRVRVNETRKKGEQRRSNLTVWEVELR